MKNKLLISMIFNIVFLIVIIGVIIFVIVDKKSNCDNESIDQLSSSDKAFIGRWEYGDKYVDMNADLIQMLNQYKQEYGILKSSNDGEYCIYGNGAAIREEKRNVTLIIKMDGSVEYTESNGYINGKCEVQIKTYAHYMGTFKNSQIIFKQCLIGDKLEEFRSIHNIYLVDENTLHYKVNDENPKSSTYLFIKSN